MEATNSTDQTPAKNSAKESPIAISEVLKEASRIKEYTGSKEYALSSFIREAELFIPIFQGTNLEEYVFQRCIVNKIQGAALDVIRTLGPDPSWKQIKTELIANFGVRETYYQLYHQALSQKNYNVSQYYFNLSNILSKLNEKYEQDIDKPSEFNPKINESMILKTFLNNIPPYMASIIHSRDIHNIRLAYHTLEETGIIRQNNSNRHKEYRESNHIGHNSQNKHANNFGQFRQTNNPIQFRQTNNSGHFRQTNNSGQFRQTNNSTSYRHSNLPRSEQRGQTSGQVRNPFRQNSYNHVEPMEIDHVDEVNFRLPAQNQIYR